MLFFNPRRKTFGGINCRTNEPIALSANVVNFLSRKGANGTIGAVDLVINANLYQNYLMSGSCIQPFTTELPMKVDF